jgi:hypothetical protein
MVTCLVAGYFLGFYAGLQQRMTKKEAASILAKASWKHRDRVRVPLPEQGFFKTVNR